MKRLYLILSLSVLLLLAGCASEPAVNDSQDDSTQEAAQEVEYVSDTTLEDIDYLEDSDEDVGDAFEEEEDPFESANPFADSNPFG